MCVCVCVCVCLSVCVIFRPALNVLKRKQQMYMLGITQSKYNYRFLF
jgi:hypothetical protein